MIRNIYAENCIFYRRTVNINKGTFRFVGYKVNINKIVQQITKRN